MPKQQGIKEIAQNRKAFHDYFVLEKYEAGIELAGTEVKSVRAGQVNMKDSYCSIKNGELFLRGMPAQFPGHAAGRRADPAVSLLQGQQSEGGDRRLQGQEAL